MMETPIKLKRSRTNNIQAPENSTFEVISFSVSRDVSSLSYFYLRMG